ncbi:Carboxymuconolactone decarboxylase family protein [Legionella moravica]|uniref:4-carboxymuconolactone decarboxylase n=1 Tax=Legionella moravica TaxID=39962 RepID=A0A378K4G8_9GAMM|nr:carboxymuconolactone decarboxylase family protein [Legionella moravica]KTD35631.1 Carboxymuconolactone decarboxylase family protein [Legionella moravica]STX62761.1 4-carboxymuconolactone decarboxylase [Legionella moravica]
MKSDDIKKDYESGVELVKKRYLPKGLDLLKQIEDFSPELADVIVRQGIHEIWQNKTPSLSMREKELMVLASIITDNTVQFEVTLHTENCLLLGVTKAEILEMLVLLTLYVGQPKVLNCLDAVKQAFANFDEHQKK